jgi:hypothetical protein
MLRPERQTRTHRQIRLIHAAVDLAALFFLVKDALLKTNGSI